MRCQYFYENGKRCIITGQFKNKREMCPQHNLITQRKVDKAKEYARRPKTISEGRPSRAKPGPRVNAKPPPDSGPIYYDHTAPWKCSLKDCDVCKHKPTYNNYMNNRIKTWESKESTT